MTDTETLLREAMRTATSPSPEPVAFDLISRRVRQRRRRHTVLAACALVAVAATTPAWVSQLDSSGDPGLPSQSGRPATTPPGESTDPSVLDPAIVQEPWTVERWQRLPRSASALPQSLDPVAATTTSLAADPVGRALAVVQGRNRGPIYLLGEDGQWREQDLVDIELTEDADGFHAAPLGVGSLSADGTQLALPQPHGLIVIDLTTSTTRRHELPGLPQRASWLPDGRQVLVSSHQDDSYRQDSVLVDAETGSWQQVPYDALLTSYADDGTAIEARLAGPSRFVYELRRFDPDGGVESVPMPVDLFEDSQISVAAGTDAVAVMRDVVTSTVPREVGAWPGATIIDIDSGEALAQIPIRGFQMLIGTHPLGWIDDGTVLVRFGEHVVAWDYQSGNLHRVTQIANDGDGVGPTVTIATALVDADS